MHWDVDTHLLNEGRLGRDIRNMHRGKKNEMFHGPQYHHRSAMSKELWWSSFLSYFCDYKMWYDTTYFKELCIAVFIGSELNDQTLYIQITDNVLSGDFLNHKGKFLEFWEQYKRNLFIMVSLEVMNINKHLKCNKGSCSTNQFMSSSEMFYEKCQGDVSQIVERIDYVHDIFCNICENNSDIDRVCKDAWKWI